VECPVKEGNGLFAHPDSSTSYFYCDHKCLLKK
jgi:hypothetical protein